MEAIQVQTTGTVTHTKSYIDRIRIRLSRIPPVPTTLVQREIDAKKDHSIGKKTHPVDVSAAENTTGTDTTEQPQSTTTTSATEPPKVFVFHNIHVSPRMPIDQTLQALWERDIRKRLDGVLQHEIPKGTYVQEFMMAGRRAKSLKPALVVTCGDHVTRKRVEKTFKTQAWLVHLLKANGLMFVALVGIKESSAGPFVVTGVPENELEKLPGASSSSATAAERSMQFIDLSIPTAGNIASPEEPTMPRLPPLTVNPNISTHLPELTDRLSSGWLLMGQEDVKILLAPGLESSCGHKLQVNPPRKPKTCTLGGLLMVNDTLVGLTARHPFLPEPLDQSSNTSDEIATDCEEYETSDDEGTNPSDDVFVFDGDDDSHNTIALPTSLGDCVASHASYIGPASGANNDSVPPDSASMLSVYEQRNQIGALDWALLRDLPSALRVMPNRVKSTVSPDLEIDDFALQPFHGDVQIVSAALGPQNGYVHLSPVTLKIELGIMDVQLITLVHPLPLGTSGAWVVHKNKLCGHIVAVREDVPWAYMLPIGPIIEDIKRKLGTDNVRLPLNADLMTKRQNPSRFPGWADSRRSPAGTLERELSLAGMPIATHDLSEKTTAGRESSISKVQSTLLNNEKTETQDPAVPVGATSSVPVLDSSSALGPEFAISGSQTQRVKHVDLKQPNHQDENPSIRPSISRPLDIVSRTNARKGRVDSPKASVKSTQERYLIGEQAASADRTQERGLSDPRHVQSLPNLTLSTVNQPLSGTLVASRRTPDTDELGIDEDRTWERDSSYQHYHTPARPQRLGIFSVISIICNGMIGSGIFTAPSIVVQYTQSLGITLLFWCAGALTAICGALMFIEYGLTSPRFRLDATGRWIPAIRSGGEIFYLKELRSRPAFLAVSSLGIIFVLLGNVATNSVLFGVRILQAAGRTDQINQWSISDSWIARSLAILVITFTYGIHAGSRSGSIYLINVFAIAKIIILVFTIILGFSYFSRSADIGPNNSSNLGLNVAFENPSKDTHTLAQAYLAIIFAFGGFNQANYVLGEINRPRRKYKWPAFFTVTGVSALYLLVNVVYLLVVPAADQISGTHVATAFFKITFESLGISGPETGARLLYAFTAISSLGNIIVMTFTASKVKQEVAKQGVLPFSGFFARSWSVPGYPLAWLFGRRKRGYYQEIPQGALFLHWIGSVILVIVLGGLDLIQVYRILRSLHSYVLDAIPGVILAIGILYLRISRSRMWAKTSSLGGRISVSAAFIYGMSMLFPVIAIWAPPSAAVLQTLMYPWYITPVVSLCIIAFGFIYWLGFYYVYPLRYKGLMLVVQNSVLLDEDNVVRYEKVRRTWIMKEAGNDNMMLEEVIVEGQVNNPDH